MRWRDLSTVMGVAASLALHVTLAILILRLPPAEDLAPGANIAEFEWRVTETPVAAGSSRVAGPAAAKDAPPLVVGGARPEQNIDAFDKGQGGEELGRTEERYLAPHADPIHLDSAPLTAVHHSQAQRIRTARDRASRENRRATPHPGEIIFLATDNGTHNERRTPSPNDPRSGAPAATAATSEGTRVTLATSFASPRASATSDTGTLEIAALRTGAGTATRHEDELRGMSANGERFLRGGARPSPGRGVDRGRGLRESERAHVAFARPAITNGPAATSSDWHDDQVRDNHDAELLASSLVESMIDASGQNGRRRGIGRGGTGGGGAPGVGGGVEAGGRSHAYTPGQGTLDALDTSSSRYRQWFLDQKRKMENALVFPRERAIALDQGTSVYRINVRRNGSLIGTPRMIRSSGFGDLDHAALVAIQASTPCDALPDDIAPGRSEVQITIPIQFSNPMVH